MWGSCQSWARGGVRVKGGVRLQIPLNPYMVFIILLPQKNSEGCAFHQCLLIINTLHLTKPNLMGLSPSLNIMYVIWNEVLLIKYPHRQLFPSFWNIWLRSSQNCYNEVARTGSGWCAQIMGHTLTFYFTCQEWCGESNLPMLQDVGIVVRGFN